MKPAPFNLLLEAASKDNILILTTNCSTACIFCSHNQNPAAVEAYYVNELTGDEIESLMEFLDESRKIVIGESATRICEGEPFLRTDIIKILRKLRKKYTNTTIQITTSGIYLDKGMLSELEQIGNIELNISLNSSSLKEREKLYRGKAHMEAVEAVKLIGNYNISFSGSIVAMPHLVGWEDIKATVMFLNHYGASVIRLFMPGYTKFSKIILPPEDIREKLMEFTEKMGSSISTPLFLEPSGVKDLNAIVEGVLKDSPAWKSGIVKGDRILRVNGADVVSRVDAFYKILKANDPELEILHDGECKKVTVCKKAKDSSGMVFNYDIHPDGIADIERGILRNGAEGCVILTSELGYYILTQCIEQNEKVRIEAVKNKYFGGNIMCAGLLTLQDIEDHLAGKIKQSEVVLLPEIMFDASGRDLLGKHFKEIEESLGIKVEVI